MGRPAAKELTDRELEIMHIFWRRGEATSAEVREDLAASGQDLAAPTVATLVKILWEKDYLTIVHPDRPVRYAPSRSFEEVSRVMLGDVIDRVFQGSRSKLLVSLAEQDGLSKKQRKKIQALLEELQE